MLVRYPNLTLYPAGLYQTFYGQSALVEKGKVKEKAIILWCAFHLTVFYLL